MTTNWSQFPIANVEPKDSPTTAHVPAPVATTLNLTDLAPHNAPAAAKTDSGSVIDFGAGFVGGLGKQAWGTAASLVGADANKAINYLQTGKSEYGLLPVVGNFISGISNTVSVAIHNPDALMKLPGQLVSNYQNGNMQAKGDIVGQATFVVGSFFVGGAGATKAAKVGGDLGEAATAAKGFEAVAQTAGAVTKLETAVSDIGRLGDFGSKIGRVGDFSALSDATRVGSVGAKLDSSVSSIIGRTGSWTERALPLENPTAFLSPTARAGSLGLSEGLSTRVMSTFTSDGSNLAAKFAGVSETAAPLSTRLSQNLSAFGRQVDFSAGVAEHIVESPVAEGFTSNVVREGAARVEPHFENLARETAAIKGGATSAEASTAVSQFENSLKGFKSAVTDGTLSGSERMQQLAQMDKNVVALENAGLDTTRIKQSMTALRTESQLAETGAQVKNVSTATQALQVSAAGQPIEVQRALQAVQDGATHLGAPLNTAERASQLASLDRNMAVVERAFGTQADALRGATSGLKVELETAQRAVQIETTAARLPEQAKLIGSTLDGLETQALAKGPEAGSAVTKLREATTQLGKAATTVERTEQLTQIDRSMAVLERELGPNPTLNSAVQELRVGSQTVDRLSRIDEAVAAVPGNASFVAQETAALRTVSSAPEVQTALTNIEKSATALRQPLAVAERTEQMAQLQRGMGAIENLGAEATPLRNAVASLQTEVSTAERLGRMETAVSELPGRSNVLTEQVSQVRQLASGSPQMQAALDGIEQMSAKLSKPITASEHAEALVQMDKNVSLVEATVGPQATGLRTAATELTATSATVERLGRLDAVISSLPTKFEAVATESSGLEAAAAAKGAHVSDALAAVRQSSTELASGMIIDRGEQMARLEKNFAVVDRELGTEAAGLRQSVSSVQNELQTAERITRFESAASELPIKSKALKEGISEVRLLTGGTTQTQVALDAIEQASVKLSRPMNAAEHAEALVQMDKNVAVVESHFGAQAVTDLRAAASEFGSTSATVERMSRLDAAFSEMPARLENVAREGSGLEAVAATKGPQVSQALAAVQESSSELVLGNAANRAEQMARLEKNMAVVDRELGAQAAGLKEGVLGLQNEVKTADRLAQLDFHASQATGQAQNIAEHVSLLRSGNSIAEASEVDVALKNLVSGADRVVAGDGIAAAERMTQMHSDLAVVEKAFGAEAAAPLRESFLQMETQSAAASRLVNLDQALAQVAERSAAVADESMLIKGLFRTAETDLAPAAVDAAKAEAGTTAATQLVNSERVVAAERATSEAVLADGAVRDTAALKAAAAADSDTALASLERNSKALSTTVDTTERAQQIVQMNKDLSAVEAYLGREATASLRESVLKVETASAAADRLATFDSASTQLIRHSEAVAQETEVLSAAAAAKGVKAEEAVAGINRASQEALATADATVRAEQIAHMNRQLAVVEDELGTKAAAGLRTSVARLESQTGTIDRLSAVDATVSQVPAKGEAVAQQIAQLRATTNSAQVETALANISRGASEASSPTAILSRTDQLSARGADLGVIERELGTPAAGQVRTALAQLDRATALARNSELELVNYQGAKISQGLGYVETAGNLGSYQQIQRLEQINHDLSVMKSVIASDSPLMQPLAQVEQHLKAVDAVSNILAHKDVARASVKELLTLVHSSDTAEATAAADRLILKGQSERVLKGKAELVESPVTGLMTERQHLWKAHKEYTALNAQMESSLFESGKLFGLQTSDPSFKRLLADISIATAGIGTALGNAGYNLNLMAAVARDNVLSAQFAAQKNQDGQAEQIRQTQGAAANAAQASTPSNTATTAAAGTASGTASDGSSAAPRVVAEAAHVSGSDQAVFNAHKDATPVGAAITALGTPKYNAAENLAANDFPVNGTPSWWWMQQHGGSPWGFARAPGATSAPEAALPVMGAPIAKAMPGVSGTRPDLTKIATTQFTIPRVMDLTSQSSLLINPMIVGRGDRSGLSMGGSSGGTRSWQTTVDWSQVSLRNNGRNEGSGSNRRGHDLKQLSGMEQSEESVDAASGGAAGATDPAHHNTLSAQVNDPNFVGANDPNQGAPIVVASHVKQDDQDAVTV